MLEILWGLIPVIIDVATGDWYELNTDNAKVVLNPK